MSAADEKRECYTRQPKICSAQLKNKTSTHQTLAALPAHDSDVDENQLSCNAHSLLRKPPPPKPHRQHTTKRRRTDKRQARSRSSGKSFQKWTAYLTEGRKNTILRPTFTQKVATRVTGTQSHQSKHCDKIFESSLAEAIRRGICVPPLALKTT